MSMRFLADTAGGDKTTVLSAGVSLDVGSAYATGVYAISASMYNISMGMASSFLFINVPPLALLIYNSITEITRFWDRNFYLSNETIA
jgi:hypothetical protein